jgi:hypothetical protein
MFKREKIMKKLVLSVAALLAGLASLSAQALTATGTFNVNITLTSACTVDTTTTPIATGATFTYTSLQATASTFSSNFNISCTNTLPITSVALDATTVTDAATNLAYTLALVGVPTAGTGVAQAITVNGNMAANQTGTCGGATCNNSLSANKTRTVTITY